jgi:hypothetical protein
MIYFSTKFLLYELLKLITEKKNISKFTAKAPSLLMVLNCPSIFFICRTVHESKCSARANREGRTSVFLLEKETMSESKERL